MDSEHSIQRWTSLAQALWLSANPIRKSTADVVRREIWDVLVAEKYPVRPISDLECLRFLEDYLWPAYEEDSPNHHVSLIAMVVSVKLQSRLHVWDLFANRTDDFTNLFRRILSMNLDDTLPLPVKYYLLSFVIGAFQSLENGLVRKQCAPLVSIATWHNLQSAAVRDNLLEDSTHRRKAWKAAAKRFNSADESLRASLRFERSWLFAMLLDFLGCLRGCQEDEANNVRYCERFTEFLIDLESQFPTRRYVNTLIKDVNLLALVKVSPLFSAEGNVHFRNLYMLLHHFVTFAVDDISGAPLTALQVDEARHKTLGRLQKVAVKHFNKKLLLLALANYGSLDRRQDLEGNLAALDEGELQLLCTLLGQRTKYPRQARVDGSREFYMESLLLSLEEHQHHLNSLATTSSLPTEKDLYNPAILQADRYNGWGSLAIPKLNLQYLSLGDFFWRSLVLHRAEACHSIRQDIELTLKRLQPRISGDGQSLSCQGFSAMAIPIRKPSIIEVVPPNVGSDRPARVKAEITLDLSSANAAVRQEWESLRSHDVVFLLTLVKARDSSVKPSSSIIDGISLRYVRAARFVHILDDRGKPLREQRVEHGSRDSQRPFFRKMMVDIDASAYREDCLANTTGGSSLYDTINMVVRRRGRENNFEPILSSIRALATAEASVPAWFQEVFLGYGDPTGISPDEEWKVLDTIDFRDTFLDWQHLVQSFPGKLLEPSGQNSTNFHPPYVLEVSNISHDSAATQSSKKRRRDQPASLKPSQTIIKVSSHQHTSRGPYLVEAPKTNRVRFTPAQIQAISSGVRPGLTLIVGPPGTGKTDVVTQTINLLYHNFPREKILLIAHGNQALNQLFQKICTLDIDERHLLRLGHGEEELDTETRYSKQGRVNSFLDNRELYLAEVDRLADSIGATGAHGNSCETAYYFNTVYIQPTWLRFWDAVSTESVSSEDLIRIFPFHNFFSTALHPLFDQNGSKEEAIGIAKGCQRHIENLFTELDIIRPFEVLRSAKERSDYLLLREARIVAMTSTQAAIRRKDITSLGFHYDSLIVEEAAQITEVEMLIPILMQSSKQTGNPLKRIILCGDHLQNSPVVQNLAIRQFANLEQSLFQRLNRLGVHSIHLDQQGRARSSIARLFQWRYPGLGDLALIKTRPEFQLANCGFAFDYQFIDVPDYQGVGEREPTPHFFQNLGEAEYAVAIYQYMRLLGYPASKITILTTYLGQRALIKDVLHHRCKGSEFFGLPKAVSTVDKYQGEQNEYVILSLTRTRTAGYLRDVRRLTVALSRARLGLYILGRRDIFEKCHEIEPAFRLLAERPDKLTLVTGEIFPTQRLLNDEIEGTPMQNLQHLGQYVYEMTQARSRVKLAVVE